MLEAKIYRNSYILKFDFALSKVRSLKYMQFEIVLLQHWTLNPRDGTEADDVWWPAKVDTAMYSVFTY